MSYSIRSLRKEFAAAGVFYTGEKLARLLAGTLAEAGAGAVTEVYDPTCGDGNLLAVFSDDVRKYGQEINPEQAEAARRRLVNAEIATGDTLTDPAFSDWKFRHIAANYPFSIKWEPREDPRWAGMPCLAPPSRADYAFILHILSMLADDGVAAVLGYPGICYRGQKEGKIRQRLVELNVIESVTHIEGGYFDDTKTATVLLVLRKRRTDRSIRFVDHEHGLERTVGFDEIAANDFNLSVSSYVQPPVEEKMVDPVALEIAARRNVLDHVKAQLAFSAQAQELHTMLGLPPLPPIGEFISDLLNIISPYAKH